MTEPVNERARGLLIDPRLAHKADEASLETPPAEAPPPESNGNNEPEIGYGTSAVRVFLGDAPAPGTEISTPKNTRRPAYLTRSDGQPATRVEADFASEPGRVSSTFAAQKTQREGQAESILRANDAWPPVEGRLYVIQIDQDSPNQRARWSVRRTWLRAYTGEAVVFRATGGRMVEQNPSGPFAAAAHPGQRSTRSNFTSVDGDDTADIAHLRSGVYQYKGKPNGANRYNPVRNRDMRVARDINHNGVIDGAAENNARFFATGLQIHAGRPDGPNSVGCQTLPPDAYAQLQQILKPARDDGFTYILVRRPNDVTGPNPF